jgi:hypothetical protein
VAKLIDQAKANPMPFAVMGLGLAWLASNSNEKDARRRSSEPRSFASDRPGLLDKAQDAASGAIGSVTDAVQGAAEHAGTTMSDTATAISDTASRSMGETRDRVATIGANAAQTAQDFSRRSRDAASDLFDREPLLVGVLGLFVGLALGAGAPATETETEKKALAPLASKVAGAAKEIAQDGLEQLSGAAEAAYSSAKDEFRRDGAPHDEPSDSEAGANGLQESTQDVSEMTLRVGS